MRRTRKAVAALRGEERGLTLIELLVAAGVGLIVVGGALTMFIGGIRSEPRTASKIAAIQEARVTVDRMTRELRQGLGTPTVASDELEIVTYVKAATCGGAPAGTSIPCQVTYSCSADYCTRRVAKPDGSAPGPEVRVATGLSSSNVFVYTPAPPAEPTYVGVSFSFAVDSGDPITLSDGVALRNYEDEDA
jgi:Tfp pilus assembly protein PilW